MLPEPGLCRREQPKTVFGVAVVGGPPALVGSDRMPAIWNPKDERQYTHILKSCVKRGRYSKGRCKRIAAGVVNKRRRREGRTLRGLGFAMGRWLR